MPEVGVEDSREKAIKYIMSLSRGLLDENMVTAYVEAGPEMVNFFRDRTPVQFYSVAGMPDYHPEFPGGSVGGGRTLECPIYPFAELGEWQGKVSMSPYFPDPRITMSETPLGKAVPEPPSEEELDRRLEKDERGCGQALIGRLLRACLDRGIEPQTEHAAKELITENGMVTGVLLKTPQGEVAVKARKGVVLATGGFEWNEDYKRTFLRGPLTHQVSMETCDGDGLTMSMKVGAKLGNMREAWWIPAAVVPEEECSKGRMLINGQRTMPHSIMVNKRGRRFTNEAANYNAFGAAFHTEDVARFEYANIPCWLVFDQTYLDTYGFGLLQAGPGEAPDWVTRAPTLADLATELDIPAGELEKTVERWNENCAAGHDPDFERGESAFDRWWGDPFRKGQKDATLGPLLKGPYYAVEIHSGALGTKGGPQTDVNGCVLNHEGDVIPGLYAAGNVMASPFGMTYGGPGGTLGPGMVFGYLSGKHAAERQTNL